jgi:2-phospho-L-lactate guanylyltransferase
MSVRGSIWALVPLKSLDGAKKRLADVLSAEERRELVRCMAGDVLEAALSAPGIAGVMVISRDPACQDLAVRAGARVFCEDSGADLNGALHQAAAALKAEGAAGVMVLPGDVPLASAPDIAAVLAGVRGAGADGRAAALVSSWHDGGTGCLLCMPPDLIAFRFGEGSFRKHAAEARALGIEPCIVASSNLSLDIDRVEDIRELLDRYVPGAKPSRTHIYLDESGIAARLATRACCSVPRPRKTYAASIRGGRI